MTPDQMHAWQLWHLQQQQQLHQQQQEESMMQEGEEEAPPLPLPLPPVDVDEVMLDMAAVDPAIKNFIHRWLAALNDAFPEQTMTWNLLLQDLDPVAQFCVLHYRSPAACLGQEPDERGALIVTQENNEFLPGLSAHDLFNQHHVSRATRMNMVSYTQCMYSLAGQWSGDALASEYEAAAAAAAASSSSSSSAMDQHQHQHGGQQQHQQQQPHVATNRYSIARYAALFNYLLERSARHETVDTGVPALNGFLATATGQWATVVVVRQLCAVHTDAAFELCRFIEERLHVNVGDAGVWTAHLLPVLMRKAFGMMQSSVRRAQTWAWFESWSKWFGPGSPIAFVSRAEYQQSGGRGILYPDTFGTDVRAVLVSDVAREALASMHLSQADVVHAFDRVLEAWARDDEATVAAILTQFTELPSVRTAFHFWARNAGVPNEVIATIGGHGGGGGLEQPQQQQQQHGGRQSQRDATIARCRQRAAEAALYGAATGGGGGGGSLAPPAADPRSIDDLMAFIGAAPVAPPVVARGGGAGGKNHKKQQQQSKRKR